MNKTFLFLFLLSGSISTFARYGNFTEPDISGFQVSLNTGVWVPQGRLSLLGNQPCLGFSLGQRSNNVMFEISCIARGLLGGQPNNTRVIYKDTTFYGSYSAGGYVGMDWAWAVLRGAGRHELDMLCGAGLDFATISLDKGVLNTYKTPDLNVGLGYRFFIRHKETDGGEHYSYIALQVKYHFLNYSIPGGSDITGSSATLGLAYGSCGRLYGFGFGDFLGGMFRGIGDNLSRGATFHR